MNKSGENKEKNGKYFKLIGPEEVEPHSEGHFHERNIISFGDNPSHSPS